MDPDVRELTKAVTTLVHKVDGLIAHYTAIDGDYERARNTLIDHEKRLQRLEQEHNFEPQNKIGESSALFTAIQSAPPITKSESKLEPEPIKIPDPEPVPEPVIEPVKPKSKLKRLINTVHEFLFVRRFFS
jgi:hypothetical protein